MGMQCRRGGGNGHPIPDTEWAHFLPHRPDGYIRAGEAWGIFLCDDHLEPHERDTLKRLNEPRKAPTPEAVADSTISMTPRRREILNVIVNHPEWLYANGKGFWLLPPGIETATRITNIVLTLRDYNYVEIVGAGSGPLGGGRGNRTTRRAVPTVDGVNYVKGLK